MVQSALHDKVYSKILNNKILSWRSKKSAGKYADLVLSSESPEGRKGGDY